MAVGRSGSVQQLHAVRVAAFDVEIPVPHEIWVDGQSRLVECAAESVDPRPAAQDRSWSGDDREAAVTELDEVAGGGQSAGPVRRADDGDTLGWFAGGVDDDERDVAGGQHLALGVVQVGQHQDDPEWVAGEQVVEPFPMRPVFTAEFGQHNGRPLARRDLLDPADDLDRPTGVQLVEDEFHQRRPGGPARPPAVAVPFDDTLDPRPGLGGDIRPAVEHLGDGRHGHAGLLRRWRRWWPPAAAAGLLAGAVEPGTPGFRDGQGWPPFRDQLSKHEASAFGAAHGVRLPIESARLCLLSHTWEFCSTY